MLFLLWIFSIFLLSFFLPSLHPCYLLSPSLVLFFSVSFLFICSSINTVIYPIIMVFSPPKFKCCNLVANVMLLRGEAFKRWLGHEDFSLMNGIKTLIFKKATHSVHSVSCFSAFCHLKTQHSSPSQDAARRCHLGSRDQFSTTSTLILDFPALRTVRNMPLFSIS